MYRLSLAGLLLLGCTTGFDLAPRNSGMPCSYNRTNEGWQFSHDSICDDVRVLAPRLSVDAIITLPNSSSFASLEVRASSPRIRPSYTAVIEPATEQDVQATIRYANRCDIPFLAVASGHGWQSTINNANGGIQINMRKFQRVDVSSSGMTAHVGGGVKQKALVQELYSKGKQAVSGLCECTSVIGPLLGGGHSALQGFHGFVSDNLVSARVVLADGHIVSASANENSDLFWALRGAGHNFGIVTSFEINLFDIPGPKWTIYTFIFLQDKLEVFIDALNKVDNGGNHVANLVLAGAITRIPSFDTRYPVIAYQPSFLGTKDEAEKYLQPFYQAGPVATVIAENVTYDDYYIVTNNGYNQTTCQADKNIFGHAISLPVYNKTAMRAAFGIFVELISEDNFRTSAWLMESYGSRGVKSHDYLASAVPDAERDLPVLTVPIIWWSGNSTADSDRANKYGNQIRTILAAGNGQGPDEAHVYLNYAVGNESLGQLYGEKERVSRLKRLKHKFDPNNRFGYYMPLV